MSLRSFSRLAVLVALACALVHAGCTAPDSSAPVREESAAAEAAPGGACVIGLKSDVRTFFEWFGLPAHERELLSLVLRPLARYDRGSGELRPALAESWETLDEGGALEVRLRRGAVWEDGTPVSSRDVVFTHGLQTSEEIGWAYREDKLNIETVEAPDEVTVRFVFRRPYAESVGDALTGLIYPAHLLEGIPPEELRESPFSDRPVGCGPFRVGRRERDQVLELVASETYYGGRPLLDRLIFRVATSKEARAALFEEGSIDLLRMADPLPFERLSADPRFRGHEVPAVRHLRLIWNTEAPALADARVRSALALGLDRKRMLELVQRGRGSLCPGPIPPWSWAFAGDLPALARDTDRAARLLEELGWRDDDGDGVRERSGRPLELSLAFPAAPYYQQTAELIRSDLAAVGARVRLLTRETGVLLDELYEGRGEAYLIADDPEDRVDLCWLAHSRAVGGDGLNWARYRNPDFDSVCDAARAAPDRERARELWHRAQEILREDQPYTYLLYRPGLHLLHGRFRGVEIGARGLYGSVEDWWVPPEERIR